MTRGRSTRRSEAAYERARRVLVGGVNSPVRAFSAVGGTPVFIASGHGSKLIDVDGNEYIDYVCGYGPGILGHAHPRVVEAVAAAAGKGFCYGAPTGPETELAEMVAAAFESIDKVRFVSSGTEAVMSAVRLARGVTGRNKIIKFIGCYHGHVDSLLLAAGSGATTLGVPASPGVPAGATADTILLPYYDLASVREAFDRHGHETAAVLVEPVAGNMGVVPPAEGFLQTLRRACDETGTLLIFDEVITGFRLAPGGAQQRFGIKADLTTLGKVVGGGLPVGAYGGPAGIMAHLAPEGPVYQAGTLAGNPIAMAAGLATLAVTRTAGFYEQLERRSATLAEGLSDAAEKAGLGGRVCVQRVGSMLCVFFTPGPVVDYESAKAGDTRAFAVYFHAMLEAGVNLAPSPYESMFLSAAHSEEDIARTVSAAEAAFARAAKFMD